MWRRYAKITLQNWRFSDKVLSDDSQKMSREMAEHRQPDSLVISHKKGVPVYERNPSVPAKDEISRPRKARLGDDRHGIVIDDGTGEILGRGGAYVYEFEEVDKERFVKLFLAGLKQASSLSKAGLAIFEIVYDQVRESPNTDQVQLSYYRARQRIRGLAERTYQRGLRELFDQEFLFRSPEDGTFFVNIRYMFNGDRLAFVKAYQVKGSQPELPLPPPELRE